MGLGLENSLRLRRVAVWIARLVVGAVFIVSGWAKAIDPWGFVIKVGEYLAVWNLDFPRELIVTCCVTLACVEFSTGVLIATACLKRWAVWVATAMMAFMLPLTLYITIADPVSDCGCFGDFLIISNWATFVKNVFIAALLIFLIFRNRTVRGIYPAPIQWLVITVSLAFPLCLSFIGYNVQPIVDFRPYKIGTTLFIPGESDAEVRYIYERDNIRKSFSLDSLPDDSWAFVDADIPEKESESMGVYDEDGVDVSSELSDETGDMVILVIPDPGIDYLSRAHYVNDLFDYVTRHDTRMIAIAGDSGEKLDEWKEWTRPRFEVFTAEDTSLKQLVRGDAAIVFLRNGIIHWKRTLNSLDASLPESSLEGNALEEVKAVDNGRLHIAIVSIYLLSMLLIYLLGLSPKIVRLFARTKIKNA